MPHRLALVAMCSLSALTGCFGLSKEEEIRLNNYKYNARLYYEKGDNARCEQQCRRGLELAPGDASLNLDLAFAVLRQGTAQQDIPRVEEARKLFLKIIDEGLSSADVQVSKAYLGLGMVELWLAKNQPTDKQDSSQQYAELADEHLNKVAELEPESIDGPLQHADLRVFQGRLAEALPFFDLGFAQIEKSNKTKERVLANKAGRSTEAQAQLKAQIETNRQLEIRSRMLKGDVLYNLGRYQDALAELTRVDELGGMTPTEYYNRGRTHEALGHAVLAVADYERFLKQSSLGVGDEKVRDALRRISSLKITSAGQPRSEPGKQP